eukprot:CAMPEP_0194558070 /NCGR_PEP_ID=MMETSP0292-20121207/124_1 /TAXON_ID=39354 /ORGANISM="Heterosigma akashiwo, Strain CCMP2393" /LENGTH=52 /DNA_ID=CAMNT_0039405629 /DNA_START=502 /DNA_END=657 /DNA_ORIENTATION=+
MQPLQIGPPSETLARGDAAAKAQRPSLLPSSIMYVAHGQHAILGRSASPQSY